MRYLTEVLVFHSWTGPDLDEKIVNIIKNILNRVNLSDGEISGRGDGRHSCLLEGSYLCLSEEGIIKVEEDK